MGRSLVVVSNAPCLKGSGLGPIIDSFDEIVRFNAYHTKGFEKDVGTRTTIWSRFHRLEKRPDLTGVTRKLSRDYPKSKVHAKAVKECELIPTAVNVWCKRQINYKQENVSSGLLVMAYLLEEYETLHAAGFFVDSLAQKDFAKHFWQPNRKGKHPKGHEPNKERELFKRWVAAGRVIELPLPDEDVYGYSCNWSNPCSVSEQSVPWEALSPDPGYTSAPQDVPGGEASKKA